LRRRAADGPGLRAPTARPPRTARGHLRRAARAALLLALVLPGCSGLALPQEAAPATGPDPSFERLIAERLKSFKDYKSYAAFEISDFRWVHGVKGWLWLACVRLQDSGHPRTFAFFVRNGAVLDDRLAVEIDGCGTQTYRPFAAAGAPAGAGPGAPAGAAVAPGPGTLDPLH
jgi:hypothetical protein